MLRHRLLALALLTLGADRAVAQIMAVGVPGSNVGYMLSTQPTGVYPMMPASSGVSGANGPRSVTWYHFQGGYSSSPQTGLPWRQQHSRTITRYRATSAPQTGGESASPSSMYVVRSRAPARIGGGTIPHEPSLMAASGVERVPPTTTVKTSTAKKTSTKKTKKKATDSKTAAPKAADAKSAPLTPASAVENAAPANAKSATPPTR